MLLIHEGGSQAAPPTPIDPSGCANFAGPLVDIVAGLHPEFDLVVSGHTHRPYVCSLPDSAAEPTLVTSAGSNGQLVTDITATLSRQSGDFTSLSGKNVMVENGVKLPDGTYLRTSPTGPFVLNPALVDAETKALIDKYRVAVAPIANRIVGTISADITRTTNAAQETALGDVIADAQLAYTQSTGAQIAFMNPGGIRTDLTYANSPGGEAPGQVTYGEAFAVQPFNNLVTTQTFTGAQIKDVLEQQRFPGTVAPNQVLDPAGVCRVHLLLRRDRGRREPGYRNGLNGVPIDPAATYRVTTNDFLANGGDGFTRLTSARTGCTRPASTSTPWRPTWTPGRSGRGRRTGSPASADGSLTPAEFRGEVAHHDCSGRARCSRRPAAGCGPRWTVVLVVVGAVIAAIGTWVFFFPILLVVLWVLVTSVRETFPYRRGVLNPLP